MKRTAQLWAFRSLSLMTMLILFKIYIYIIATLIVVYIDMCKAFGVIITYLSGLLLLRLADLLKNGPRPLDLLMLRDHEVISDGIV